MACGTWKCNPGLGWHMCGLMEINTCIAACAWKWCKMMMIMTTTTRRTRTRTRMMMMMMMVVMLTMKIIIIVIATLKNWGIWDFILECGRSFDRCWGCSHGVWSVWTSAMHGPFRPCSSGDLPDNFFQPELRSLERANDLLGISVEAGLCWESRPVRRGILTQHVFSHSSHSRILFDIYILYID